MKILNNRASFTAAVLCALFALSILPMLLVSFYTNPAVDDFVAMNQMKEAVQTGSLIQILKGAKDVAMYYYYGWQGTFAACALISLQPAIFSSDLYFISTFLFLGGLIGSTFFFLHAVLVKWLRQPVSHWLILSCLVLFLQIQFVPSIPEAFFWYSGACLYIYFYSFSLILFGAVIHMLLMDSAWKRLILAILLCPLAFLIGGGNFSTSLFVSCVFALLLFGLAVRKHPAIGCILLVTLAFGAGFLLAITAPGNEVRSTYFVQLHPVEAIMQSLIMAFGYGNEWTTFAVLAVLFASLPIVSKAAQESTLSFRYPLLAMAIAFGLYACLLTPALFAMNYPGDGRQRNIYYFTYIMMLLFDLFYISGWIIQNGNSLPFSQSICALFHKHFFSLALVCVLLFTGTCISRGTIFTTSPACLHYYLNGMAQEHSQFMRRQQQEAWATEGDFVITQASPPVTIFMSNYLPEDPNDMLNTAYADYHGCRSVVYKPS